MSFGRVPPPTQEMTPGQARFSAGCAVWSLALALMLAGVALAGWTAWRAATHGWQPKMLLLLAYSAGIVVAGLLLVAAVRLWKRHF